MSDATGERLREIGGEFGVVTGRPRRCGWLDLAALRYAVDVNGITHLAMTKLDVLDEFSEVGVCSEYADGRLGEGQSLPLAIAAGARCATTTLPGWRSSTSSTRSWEDLPARAREYVAFVEGAARVPVSYVSVGPERSQIIVRPSAPLRAAAGVR